ncbi:MAG: DinB family protein [Litorilinea sp.]
MTTPENASPENNSLPPGSPVEEVADALVRSFDDLCHVLDQLAPAEREAPGLDGGWSAKVQLAHMAFWDNFQLARMQAAYAGTSVDGYARPDHDNDDRGAADAARAWEDVLAEAQAARRRMVEFAQGLDPDVLTREYPEGASTFSIGNQLRHMARHTQAHTRPIRHYCGSLQRWTRASLRAFLVEQHANLLAGADGLSTETLHTVPVCGIWTIRDVLAHVLSWNEHAHLLITHWPAPPADLVAEWPLGLPMDTINAGLMAARAQWRLDDIRERLAWHHARLLQAFDAARDADLSSVGQTWLGEAALSLQFYEAALHEAEHAQQIWDYRQGK